MLTNTILRAAALGSAVAAAMGTANAQKINVTADITVPTTWFSTNTYDLRRDIAVQAGATLTIQAGTVVCTSAPVTNPVDPEFGLDENRSLRVERGAQIFVKGRAEAPVIMTSAADVATWTPDAGHPTGGNPKTGTWREAADEWGNLTLMGRGFISENAEAGNVPTCNANNEAPMEGLVESFPGDPSVRYGGGDDNDDSGSISYLSLRYGGRVEDPNVELNGLSLGGIGRETDIHHVEIMNNLDDGVEIWGGTVNLKYMSIWNIGDDSLDIDQGWRGTHQFGLIVQGYSIDTSQGGGVGDNAIETDGAEDSDWQPVTTGRVYNYTVIGQPIDGDGLTTWRDNARIQYRNCIFMDGGEALVKFDNIDGDGAHGYGFNGTLSWPATWTTAYNAVPAHANDCPVGTYTAQTDGNLAEIRNSVFFRNLNGSAYTEADARGVRNAGNLNVTIPGFDDADSPVCALTRGPLVSRGGKSMLPVTFLDPRPKNEALTSTEGADYVINCFSDARYRGGFIPEQSWLHFWTASEAYGFTPTSQFVDLGKACPGTNGDLHCSGSGDQSVPMGATIKLSNAIPGAAAFFVGTSLLEDVLPGFELFGCKIGPLPIFGPAIPVVAGQATWTWGNLPSGGTYYYQWGQIDPGAPAGVSFSNTICGRVP
ncbi:MAG: hypothetical protein KDB80_13925 [Planctomycetes bacterium]|nr:hypothetical protein [Planctomycetota bacterium]